MMKMLVTAIILIYSYESKSSEIIVKLNEIKSNYGIENTYLVETVVDICLIKKMKDSTIFFNSKEEKVCLVESHYGDKEKVILVRYFLNSCNKISSIKAC